MKEEEILKKAIEKVVKNGWKGLEMWSKTFEVSFDKTESLRKWVWIEYEEGDGESLPLRDLIFDHKFAIAFWGEYPPQKGYNDNPFWDEHSTDSLKYWQYHLQEMVLEENPIKYLEKFV